MKIKAFLISTLVSTFLQSLYFAVITGITLFLLPNMLETVVQDMPANGSPPPGFFNFMGISMLTGGIGLVLAPLVHAGTGALYAWLHRREDDSSLTVELGAFGGAAAAFTARFAAGLLMALGSLLVSSLIMQTVGDAIGSVPNAGTQPFTTPIDSVIFSGVSSVIGGLFSACFGSVIAALIGALGGALTGAVLK